MWLRLLGYENHIEMLKLAARIVFTRGVDDLLFSTIKIHVLVAVSAWHGQPWCRFDLTECFVGLCVASLLVLLF